MATDPRKVRPTELCRLLNSSPLGEVISERQLHRHRNRAGFRIGDGKTVDLFRYIAWLVSVRHAPRADADSLTGYEAIKEQARARNALLSLSGRDIGELPAVVNPERKAQAAASFRFFCETYFPRTFHLAWSTDHLQVIAKVEEAVLHGGLFALAMPRGSGKTTIAECACLWAILFGHREFVTLIGASEVHAEEMLDSIKMELEGNEALLEDFPEAVFPIHCLEGISNRAPGQLYEGERTHIAWTAKEIVLPTMPGSKASGAIIKVAGITGRIRGMKYKRADGQSVRPSLVILDDPQTDESARSPSQCAHRESILSGAVLGLCGPGRKIAGVMPCTIISRDDLADRCLDRQRNPQWQGTRTQMLYGAPTAVELWDRYFALRAEGQRKELGTAEATEFYRHNQAQMDAGCRPAWPARFNPDEISATQHAMNRRQDLGDAAWRAECQNDPQVLEEANGTLQASVLCERINRLPSGVAPEDASCVTAFIDVQGALLYWLVAAWRENFTGAIIAYGTYPEQRRAYFQLREAAPTLADMAKGAGLEGSIHAGLTQLAETLCGREWKRADGATLRIGRLLVDAGWGQSTDTVYAWCRQSVFASVVAPSHGRGITASARPMSTYAHRPGEQHGQNWIYGTGGQARMVRHVIFDTNHWKTFVAGRLTTAIGDPGAITLYGEHPDEHRMLCDHLTAEFRVQTAGQGRSLEEWKALPGRENHWWDCLVGSAVAASMCGVQVPEARVVKKLEPFVIPAHRLRR